MKTGLSLISLFVVLTAIFSTAVAQTSVIRNYEGVSSSYIDISDHKSSESSEKYVELRLQPAVSGQNPMIRFSFTSSPSAKYGGKAIWFEKGKSRYYKCVDDLDGKKFNSLMLYSDNFNLFVSIMQPQDKFSWGYICLISQTTGNSTWINMTPKDIDEIMDLVSKEVKRLNFPKSQSSSLDI